MDKLRIIVNDDNESLEVQGLLESIGYRKIHHWGNYKSPKKIMTNEDWYSDYTIDSDEYNSRKTITLPQLRDLVAQSKSEEREYLDPNDNYKLCLINPSDAAHWMIEVPGGAEIAIKFNVDVDAHGVCFYKDNGKLSFSQNDPSWNESLWTQEELLDENFSNGVTDLTHKVLWIREQKDQGLISGAEALRALADGKNVQVSTEHTRSTWDNDTATYSAEEILAEETAETDDYNSMKLFFRLKPQTIKLELEIPAPFKAKIGGRDDASFVLNVGRHQYLYQNEDDYTQARNALETVFDAALGGNNS